MPFQRLKQHLPLFSYGFLTVSFMQGMRLKSQDVGIIWVTLNVPEHLQTRWDGELFVGKLRSLCAPCRKLWWLSRSCEPTLGVSYMSTPLWIFFFLSLITEPGLIDICAWLPQGVYGVQTPSEKNIVQLCVKILPASVPAVIVPRYYFKFTCSGGPDISKMIPFEHTGLTKCQVRAGSKAD